MISYEFGDLVLVPFPPSRTKTPEEAVFSRSLSGPKPNQTS